MKTKLFMIGILFMLMFSSCVAIKDIGNLTMVSTRNVETTKSYQSIKKYASLTKKELRKTRATSIQAAIDEVVRKVDGGEYLMNVKIYQVAKSNGFAVLYYYAVEGDVWGTQPK